MSTPIFDIADVATICGVGCDYRIRHETDGSFTVTVSSGPVVGKVVLEGVTWLESMSYVANEIESDLAIETGTFAERKLTVTKVAPPKTL